MARKRAPNIHQEGSDAIVAPVTGFRAGPQLHVFGGPVRHAIKRKESTGSLRLGLSAADGGRLLTPTVLLRRSAGTAKGLGLTLNVRPTEMTSHAR